MDVNSTAESLQIHTIIVHPLILDVSVIEISVPFCRILMCFVLRTSNGKMYIALSDSVPEFSATNPEVAVDSRVQKSDNAVSARTAYAQVSRHILNQHVELTYNLSKSRDTFKTFPGLNVDVLFGLDLMYKHSPRTPRWNVGILFISEMVKIILKTFEIRAIAHRQSSIAPKDILPHVTPVSVPSSGLISALEVGDSSDWDCMVAFIHQNNVDTEGFAKPHFEEPPLHHTQDQERIWGNPLRENKDVLRTYLPNVIPPHRLGDTPIITTFDGAKPVQKLAFKTSPV